jgi:UDP-N-acetylglucosamine--N-acetylmuramyl-(pentapeptide) pyrophosphoryl-undecaprenol N-acetylglucosamine transferase
VRIVIAGGGTGGHTSAALAVAATLRRDGHTDIHWIGSRDGLEATRAPEAGLTFHAIATGKIRRYWDRRNISDLLVNVPVGVLQSWQLLRRLRPALLFATGGFVSVPPSLAARVLGIPIVVHEQTSVPGLANRLTGRWAARIAVSFPVRGGVFPPERVVLTGNPLRPALRDGSAAAAFTRFGFDPGLPLVYVTGGAQGSNRINRAVGEALPTLLPTCQILHQCGDNRETGDRRWLEGKAGALPPQLKPRFVVSPWVGEELRDVYAAASLCIGRSGAGTINEICQLGVPALFVPLPGTSGDEQTANARLVAEAGGAVILPQSELSPETLTAAVQRLLDDRKALAAMGAKARSLAVRDAADRLARLLLEVARP